LFPRSDSGQAGKKTTIYVKKEKKEKRKGTKLFGISRKEKKKRCPVYAAGLIS